jgi:NADP-dependent 3-hydroxy acid dehydrogenase YdfG
VQTIIITGGSSGIGEAVAIRFARRRDWAILLAGKTEHKVNSAFARCHQLTDAPIDTVVGDIRDDRVSEEIILKASALGELRAVVNSAGFGSFASLVDMKGEKVRELFEVNVLALLRVCQLATPILCQNGGGTIVNISSDADRVGFSGATAYCGTKAAVLGASRALQTELRSLGIRVTVISPGRVDTYFNQKKPGMRPGAIAADEVAEVVEFAVTCNSNMELTEIRIDSLTRPS